MFKTYLTLGYEHISDINAYDHILFIVALCAIYSVSQWRNVLVLVTAFTIGHSATLALSALDIVTVKSEIIEFLIPLTIFVTAMHNIFVKYQTQKRIRWNYMMALFFGFIHGMGFSNYFKALLGREQSIIKPLFAFNIGVELGQLLIVGIIMAFSYVVLNVFKAKQRDWNLVISGAAAGVALILMMETKFW